MAFWGRSDYAICRTPAEAVAGVPRDKVASPTDMTGLSCRRPVAVIHTAEKTSQEALIFFVLRTKISLQIACDWSSSYVPTPWLWYALLDWK